MIVVTKPMGNKTYRVVSPEIWEQICLVRDVIKKSPNFDLVTKHRVIHSLGVEAARHSVGIELPNGHQARRGRAQRVAEENLRSAQLYFEGHYGGELTDQLIMQSAGLLEPHITPVAYRSPTDPTTLSLGKNPHVYPANVEEQMDKFLKMNSRIYTSVGQAVHAHFHLARIHPFKDGNGRTARLVQNGILNYNGFPPVVLEKYERSQYLDLVSLASASSMESDSIFRVTPDQAAFYNFMATKVLDSLKHLLRESNAN